MMSQVTEAERAEKIRMWMAGVIEHRSYERYDDLHLDKIDPAYREPSTWLSAGASCLNTAIAIRDANRWPYAVALGMSLKAGPERIGRNFNRYAGVASELDWTAPSLYLFPRDDRSWLGGPELEELGSACRAPTSAAHQVFFREWHDANDQEYRRSLWFVG